MAQQSHYRLSDFELYKVAREFRRKVYALIKQLPADEKYCLAPQMRRAAISVTNNIAEGHGRWWHQDNIRFCQIARGSVEEVLDDLNLCEDEHYGDQAIVTALQQEAEQLHARINSYIAYLKRNKPE